MNRVVIRIDEAVRSQDSDALFDPALTAEAASALWRVRRSPSQAASVFLALAVLHQKRWDATGQPVDNDLALLFMHSRDAARPLAVLREAEVLRAGRHRPPGRLRPGEQRPFTEYLSGRRELVEARRGVADPEVVDEAEELSLRLFDDALKREVDDFLTSLGATPPQDGGSPFGALVDSVVHEQQDQSLWEERVLHLAREAARPDTPAAELARDCLAVAQKRLLHRATEAERRFDSSGDPDDLERAAVALSRASFCDAVSGGGKEAASYSMRIGELSAERFVHQGVWDDIVHATVAMRMAIDRLPARDARRVEYRLRLAMTLKSAHEHMSATYGAAGGTENVDAAVCELRIAEKALEELDVPGSPAGPGRGGVLRAWVVLHLGHCLFLRALAGSDADEADRELDRALDLFDQVHALVRRRGTLGLPRRDRGGRLQGGGLRARLRLCRTQARVLRSFVDKRITGLWRAAFLGLWRGSTTRNPFERMQWRQLTGAADALQRLLSGRDRSHVNLLAFLGSSALVDSDAPGPHRSIRVARLFGVLAMVNGSWGRAASLLRTGLERALLQDQLGIPDLARLAWLSQCRGMAGDLVSSLLSSSKVPEAVVAFERHRAVLSSEVLAERVGLAGLGRTRPELERAYREIAERLRRFEISVDAHRPNHASRRRALLAERESVVRRIRAVRGLERFRQDPRYADLLAASGQGSVVLLNAGSLRGEALVLNDGKSP